MVAQLLLVQQLINLSLFLFGIIELALYYGKEKSLVLLGFFLPLLNIIMEYKLYTLVDITHTKQPRTNEERWREQNFNTVLQTLGIRANVVYTTSPVTLETQGRLVGFDTDEILNLWRFDFSTDRDALYESGSDPIGLLKQDFHLVPYIGGLGENMEQKYAVFNTANPGKNISFYQK